MSEDKSNGAGDARSLWDRETSCPSPSVPLAASSAIALKGAEAAVIRAAVYYRTHPLSHGRYKRLDDAVDKLLRAREIRGR